MIILYIILNVCVFILYGVDKWKACHHKWRISETSLLVAAVFGVIGAWAGMYAFHHKTRKPKFYLGVPVILVGEMIVWSLCFSCF